MAKGKKTGGKDFAPGVSGNPNGRPPVPADIRAARDLNRVEFDALSNTLLRFTKKELDELLKDKDTPALTIIIARIVRSAMWSSDPKRLIFLMNRMIGRPQLEQDPKDILVTRKGPEDLSDEELDKQLKAFRKKGRQHA